jgi:endoglucanase
MSSCSRRPTHPFASHIRSFFSSGPLAAVLAAAVVAGSCGDAPTIIGPEHASRASSDSPLTVWWPTADAWLEGVHPFQADMEGWALSDYRLFWQVDGGKLNSMPDSYEGGPHKRALVDVSGWDWRGSGPYEVTFEARARRGNRVLARRSVTIYVGAGPEAPGRTLDVASPMEGARLGGEQLFRARVPELSLSDYRVTWRVDGGEETSMAAGSGDPSYYESAVDVSSWSWSGEGPYTVLFVARALDGSVLVEESVRVFVAHDDDPPPPDSGGSPLSALPFYIDPYSNARRQADEWRDSRPADAAMMDRIATQSQADWFGDWNSDIRAAVDARATAITAAGAFPIFVAYNIHLRDCNSYSGGGARSADGYRSWIRAFAAGLGDRTAAVILEPDAVTLMDCLSSSQRQERLAALRDAVDVLKATQGVLVYIDAGHSAWLPVATLVDRLRDAGIERADGFALNTSNFQATSASVTYGEAVSAYLAGSHFVVDTSRNGNGPTEDNQWCNPPGRALGANPTAETGHALVDAFLWIKRPGESDGTCNGGPSAGAWWADYALGLAERQPVLLAGTD